MKGNDLTLKKQKTISRLFPAESITDACGVDDLALLSNIPAQAECLQHSLKKAARGIGLCVNSNKKIWILNKSHLHIKL